MQGSSEIDSLRSIRPDRVRGVSCINPNDIPDSEVEQPEQPASTKCISMSRPERVRGHSVRGLCIEDLCIDNIKDSGSLVDITENSGTQEEDTNETIRENSDKQVEQPASTKFVSMSRPERIRGHSVRNLCVDDICIKGEGASGYLADITENSGSQEDATNDETASSLSMVDNLEEFIPGRMCTLGFSETDKKPIRKVMANCPDGKVEKIKSGFGQSHNNVVVYKRQANCPDGKVEEIKSELGQSRSNVIVYKRQANCPDGQVQDAKQTFETQRPGLGRVGRQASVRPSKSIKETLKAFQS